MNQFLSPTAIGIYVAAALLLGMTAVVVVRNRRNASTKKIALDATMVHLRKKAAELLGVHIGSPLAARKRLLQDLEQFRTRAGELGQDPDAFICIENQNTIRQIARAARQELDLSESLAPAPIDPIVTVFTPTPSDHADLRHAAELEQDGDLTVRGSLPEIAGTDDGEETGRFDRDSLTDLENEDDSPTGLYDRASLEAAELDTVVDRAIDRLTSSGTSDVFFVTEDAEAALEQAN